MCSGAEVAMMALMAAGSGLQAYEQQRALRRQERAAAEAMRRQQMFQERARRQVERTLEAFRPERRAERQAAAAEAEQEAFEDALATARERAGGLIRPVAGRISGAYDTARARAVADETARAARIASLLARIRAPGLAGRQEAWRMGDLAVDLGMLGNFSRGQAGVDELAIRAAGRTSPWTMLAGDALKGYAAGRMMSAAYGRGRAGTSKLTVGGG